MSTRQRLALFGGTAAVVLVVLALASRSTQIDIGRLELREPVLALPEPTRVLLPGADGEPVLLAVIENTPKARPQSGLAGACLVYVVPTEARITRFLATHCQRASAAIGPIRSARRYMLEIASDLGAVLVHAGASAEAQGLIIGRRLPVLNEFWTPGPFWRDPAKPMPHNLYTSVDRLREALARKPVKTDPKPSLYRFSSGADLTVGPDAAPAPEVLLDYGLLYAVRYRYDAARERYLRDQDGRPQVDADGAEVAPGSVLVLFVRWQDVLVRGQPSSRIDLVGGGRMVVLSGGRLVEGTWSRPVAGTMRVADGGGREIALPPGPVWIELFPRDRPFTVQAPPNP